MVFCQQQHGTIGQIDAVRLDRFERRKWWHVQLFPGTGVSGLAGIRRNDRVDRLGGQRDSRKQGRREYACEQTHAVRHRAPPGWVAAGAVPAACTGGSISL